MRGHLETIVYLDNEQYGMEFHSRRSDFRGYAELREDIQPR